MLHCQRRASGVEDPSPRFEVSKPHGTMRKLLESLSLGVAPDVDWTRSECPHAHAPFARSSYAAPPF